MHWKKIGGSAAAIGALLGALVLTPSAASGAGPAPALSMADQETDTSTGFGFNTSGGFDGYYAALTSAVAPDVAAEELRHPSPEVLDLPGIQEVSEEQRSAILSEAADAALEGEALPVGLVSSSSGEMEARNLGAPILGGPINNNRSWQHKDTFYWENCNVSCNISGTVHFTYTIDPGEIRSRLTISTLELGNGLDYFTPYVKPYFNAQDWGSYSGVPWGTNDTKTMTIEHSSTAGISVIYHIATVVWGPSNGIAQEFEWRTNPTAPCEEPTPGAYRCRFPG